MNLIRSVFYMLCGSAFAVASISEPDLCGALLDENKNVLYSSDDISDENLNFQIVYSLKVGKTYYLRISGSTVSTAGNAKVQISWSGDCTLTGTSYSKRTMYVVYLSDYYLPE